MRNSVQVWWILGTILVGSCSVWSKNASFQKVKLGQGELVGTQGTSRGNKSYSMFLGIPYAQPPKGDLRFKDPLPHKGWSGVLNATTFGNECPQKNLGTNVYSGDEDCLFLNVYTPKLDRVTPPLPVMVYIHGGAYKAGSGNYFKEKYFMDKPIVFVTLNFRIGIFGFLSFSDDVLPGNLGLKDLILGLKWVQENIKHFGGDLTRVTIFGGSSGGSAVDYLVVSPLAKGLFFNAIMQGGAATAPWGFIPKAMAVQRAEAVCTLLGCPSSPTQEAVNCLREIPSVNFILATDKFLELNMFPIGSFSPVIDGHLGPETSAVPKFPLALPPNPNINVIIGFNSYEGDMIASIVCFNDFYLAKSMMSDYARTLATMTVQDHVTYDEKERLATELTEYYLEGRNITKDNIIKFSDLGTDLIFGQPAIKAALNYYRHVPLYFYLYDVEPRVPLVSVFGQCPYLKGPSHGEEIVYFFNDLFPIIQLDKEEVERSHKLLDLWTNFATTGVPSPNWTRVTSDHIDYLRMHKNNFQMESGLYEDRMRFVDTLPLLTNRYNVRHEKVEL